MQTQLCKQPLMWSLTDLVEDMQTQTPTLLGILSLISQNSLDNDELFLHPCPKDVAHGNLSLHSIGKINNLMILFFPSYLVNFPVFSIYLVLRWTVAGHMGSNDRH